MDVAALTAKYNDSLRAYQFLLLEWSDKVNLIAKSTHDNVWERHILDCLQISSLISPSQQSLVDVGSGAGLPGVVLAITHPSIHITLIEKDIKKVAFLTHVKASLGLKNLVIKASRWEDIKLKFDLITSRALTRLVELLNIMFCLGEASSTGVFPKGSSWEQELHEAQKIWDFDYETQRSITDEQSAIISIRNLRQRIA